MFSYLEIRLKNVEDGLIQMCLEVARLQVLGPVQMNNLHTHIDIP